MSKISHISTLLVSIIAIGTVSIIIENDVQATTKVTQLAEVIKSPNDNRPYAAIRLDNDIEVLMISDPDAEKSAVALGVGAGFLFEPLSQQGLSHFLEHMLFQGTDKYPDTDEYSTFVSTNGGQSNAYTWMDITNYQLKINFSACSV